jgi:hypothetical protein
MRVLRGEAIHLNPGNTMSHETPENSRYFLTYSGVKLPLTLLNELEPTQLENRITYFRGLYDAADRLVGLQKMVYGEIEMEHRYQYGPAGHLQRAEIIDIDGEITVMEFDEEGKLLAQ